VPELPDVEGFRRYFSRHAAGERVERVEVLDRTMVRNSSAQGVRRALGGRRFEKPRRRGKWLIAPAGGPLILMHFGMTGLLAWSSDPSGRHPHDRVVFHLPGGQLAYRNMRKFGGLWLARDERQAEGVMGPLGPDAADLDRDALARLADRRRAIKALLMDQKALAGVGNLLSDEVLWRARIHPRRRAGELSRRELSALHDALQDTIREANRHGRIPPKRGWLTAVRDEGGDCPRCGRRVRRDTVAGRTACWCPRCQRKRR
jgi:formamidopyrimidine-DNA glycosylase